MNRQSVIVTVIAGLVLLGLALLLYGGGGTDQPQPIPSQGPRSAKAAKRPDSAKRIDAAKLIRKRAIPDDRRAAPAGAPNVVFVVASTQRRDQWTVYGGPENTTPFLAERVRAAGVWFEDALAVSVDPHPTTAALLTGRYPHALGVVELREKLNVRRTPNAATTLAEVFADSGWFTMGLSANHHANTRAGLSQGFDWFRNSQPFSLKLGARIDARNLVRIALDRLSRRNESEKARPLYLQLALVDSHKPFRVPPAEYNAFEAPEHDVAPYRATVRRLDDALRFLVDGLGKQGIDESNTLFVVVADHGEGLSMPESHRFQHGFVLYESSVRIPWVMWGHTLPKGRAVPGLASQIDVVPTVLDWLGLEVPAAVDGSSHASAVREGTTQRDQAYADATYRGIHRASIWTTDRQCQRDFGSLQNLEDDSFVDGCFDRKTDPEFTASFVDDDLMAKLDELHETLAALADAPAN
ncbi:MAG: sulfatase [Myxococcota bacterium]